MSAPTNLIIVLYSEYCRIEALSHIGRMSKHRSGSSRQLIFPDHNIVPPVSEQKNRSQSALGYFIGKDKKQDDPPPSWMGMVIKANKFVTNHFAAGDKIILFGLSGGIGDDFVLVNTMVMELAKRLDEGGIEISCIAHIHRDRNRGIYELNNRFLEAAPLSVKHVFNFNWESGKESYCSTIRDSMGRVNSREACFYKADGSHYPPVMHATMGFIRYRGELTREWSSLQPGRMISSSTTGNFATSNPTSVSVSLVHLGPNVPGDACSKPFGMTGFDIYKYSSFRKPNEDLHLPPRLLWRTTYS